MCMIDDGERPEFYTSRDSTARRSHVCCECRRAILPGEQYRVCSGKWAGEFSVYKTCAHCLQAKAWLERECGGSIFGMVLEDLREHWFESPAYRSGGLGRLIVGMRRQWQGFKSGLLPVPGALTT